MLLEQPYCHGSRHSGKQHANDQPRTGYGPRAAIGVPAAASEKDPAAGRFFMSPDGVDCRRPHPPTGRRGSR
jgi:hypothetical protein